MSLQTQWMRKTDKKNIQVCHDEKGYWCIEWVNHPTPSGCERWMPTYEDNRRWPDEATAKTEFNKLLEEIDKAYKEKFGNLA